MNINILRKGDRVLNVTADNIIVERKDKTVEIIPLITDSSGVRVDIPNIVTIGYGNNIVQTKLTDDVVITNF